MIGHMKDRGSLIQLLDAFGAEPTDSLYPNDHKYHVEELDNGGCCVTIGHGVGYRDFYCDFIFDENGHFVEWAIYE